MEAFTRTPEIEQEDEKTGRESLETSLPDFL
jgi:hypothetical protein